MKKLLITIIILAITVLFLLQSPTTTQAEQKILSQQSPVTSLEETLEGKIVAILEEKPITFADLGKSQLYQKLEIMTTKGSLVNRKITVENGHLPSSNWRQYQIGDRLMISYTSDPQNNQIFHIIDYVRRDAILWLFAIFLSTVLIITRQQGIASLLGLLVSFGIIFKVILPQISAGHNPVQVAITGSLLIIPSTFLLAHGISKKTLIAIAGTVITLILTGWLASVFVDIIKLSGFATEEANFLQAYKQETVNIKGLLLAGIIISILGVLDDVTISQAAIIQQLKSANPNLRFQELYQKAMSIGKDHIASMVNTLILVYTGTSLPLLLIFIDNPRPFSEIINYEIIADEIVRTLVGSIGLMLAIPITTLLAAVTTKPNEK